MTMRNWLKQFEGYADVWLDKEILIECPNGLLVTPVIKRKQKDNVFLAKSHEDFDAMVITIH
jgi:hypothetical protein